MSTNSNTNLSSNTIKFNSKRIIDMTVGDPMKNILKFALPLFLSNLLMQFYNLTDIAIVGNALGDDALSAVGAVSTIYSLFISLCFGMSNGFSIVIAKHFGACDYKKMRKAVGNTILIFVVWGVLIKVVSLLTLKPLMHALNTPPELFDEAYGYISIILSFMIFSFAYNVQAGIMRALGNSKDPLLFLMVSTVTNVGLDLLFVYVFKWGIRGAALATGLSFVLAAVFAFVFIVKKVPELRLSRSDFKVDKNLMIDLFTSGLSFAMMFTIVNLGTLILQSAINGFGKTIIAAHTTARKVSELCIMPLSTLATTLATFSGQNHGAGKHLRVWKGIKKSLLLSYGVIIIMIFIIYFFGRSIVTGLSGSESSKLISTAVLYLKFDLPFYFVLAILLFTRSSLQGLGSKIVPLVASIMELVLKIATVGFLAKHYGYWGIIVCEPISWILCSIFNVIAFFMNHNIRNAMREAKLSKKSKIKLSSADTNESLSD
ncbi:MAG: MATE family efflux transporter [Saccharofermentanaceae bacterium]